MWERGCRCNEKTSVVTDVFPWLTSPVWNQIPYGKPGDFVGGIRPFWMSRSDTNMDRSTVVKIAIIRRAICRPLGILDVLS